jgi:Fur family ferric uptake transcriptional regulator
LICEKCGRVTELKEDLLEKLETEIEKTKGFVVKDHRVKIYGTCKKCRKERDKL